MTTQMVASITCPNCRSPFTTPVQQIIDVQEDPEAKSRLLSGQLNTVICPHCGFQGALNAPFLYHDAELEIAFVYVPMGVGATNVEQQKAIGDLTNRLMSRLPPEARKGYLLHPRIFISQQGLVDAMLEKDEATREMVETQRRKMELLGQLRQIDPQDSLAVAAFVGANDRELDEMFFQILGFMIGIAESQGNTAERDRLAQHQANLLEKSSVGRLFKAQQAAVETLTANPTRETLVEQLIAADARIVREVLVSVGRQLLDYSFFQALTARIEAVEAAGDGAAKEKLVALRREVLEIRDEVDTRVKAVLDARASLLWDLMTADDVRELALRHLPELDSAFFSVLSSSMQQAERGGRQDMVQQLRRVGDAVIELLDEMVPPEIQLINRLVEAENDEQVRQVLEEERERLDDDFLKLVEHAVQDLEQGDRQQSAERLRYAADQIRQRLEIGD
jgi:hypothetical protein